MTRYHDHGVRIFILAAVAQAVIDAPGFAKRSPWTKRAANADLCAPLDWLATDGAEYMRLLRGQDEADQLLDKVAAMRDQQSQIK